MRFRMRYLAEEFGVDAEAVQFYGVAVDAVDQHLVGLDVTVAVILPVPRKGVITVFFGHLLPCSRCPKTSIRGALRPNFCRSLSKRRLVLIFRMGKCLGQCFHAVKMADGTIFHIPDGFAQHRFAVAT